MVQQPVAQLPWGHITVLLDKLDAIQLREWYAAQAVEHGWSRAVLAHQIMSDLHSRVGAAPSSFARTLPAGDSELVQEMTKDPYHLEFLDLAGQVAERHLEDALMTHLQRFLLELGAGFAFVGRQYRLQVGAEEFFVDLLFYHVRLRRYIVVELKTRPFKPEYAGQLNFYVNVVDDQLRGDGDGETVADAAVRQPRRGSRPLRPARLCHPDGGGRLPVPGLPDDVRALFPAEADLDATIRSALGPREQR